MKHFILLFTVGLFTLANLQAYNSLRILNPRSWGSDQGEINTADIKITPKGLYVQYDVVLEFSARETYFNSGDSLEVEMHFDLPEGAIVNDSWLLIGDSIVKADLIDRWTASAIYEGIVKRMKDPSVLYKNSATDYELRIFPILKNEDRIAGISYLLPVQWDSQSVHTVLPFRMLNTSMNEVSVGIHLPENQISGVKLAGEELELKPGEHEFVGTTMSTRVNSRDYYNDVSLSISSEMPNGVFASKAKVNGEGYYQLALLPSTIIDFEYNEKLMILVDYDVSKTTFSKAEIVDQIKQQLGSYSSTDSFMLYYSDVTAKALTDHWVSCNSASVEETLSGLEEKLGNYSALPSLLTASTEYVTGNAPSAKIVLIGTSDQAGDYKIANSIMEDLKEISQELPTFYVGDFANDHITYFYQGGKHYTGNEYLYILLTKQTKGALVFARNNSLQASMAELFQSTSGKLNNIDLYTTLQDGFCYGRYFNVDIDQGIYMHQPITQIGKYIGDFPMEINFSGTYNDQPFSSKYVIEASDMISSDSVLAKCWSGRYINALERQSHSTESVHEIIEYSMENRILSRYTAFIALEPGMEIDLDNDDDEFITDVENMKADNNDINLSAYPNPFRNKLTIAFNIPENVDSEQVIIRIYNVTGQVVKEIEVSAGMAGQEFKFVWDKSDTNGSSIPAGQYIVVITGPGFTNSVNVVSQ